MELPSSDDVGDCDMEQRDVGPARVRGLPTLDPPGKTGDLRERALPQE
jgi:hypothetical protein